MVMPWIPAQPEIRPANKWWFGSPMLPVNHSRHAVSSASPTLTQTHSLFPENTSHGTSSSSPTLTVSYRVSPAPSTHSVTSGEPTLQQFSKVFPVAAAHSQSVTEPTMAQSQTVPPNSSGHIQSSDSPEIVLLGEINPRNGLLHVSSTSPTVRSEESPSGGTYWVRARYAHQGQEKPDQPDNSWDPYNGGSPTSPDIPWWNLSPMEAGCPVWDFANPGDTYTMPEVPFYPGEAVVSTDRNRGYGHDLSTGTITAGAWTFYAGDFEPAPYLTQSYWLVEVTGTGELSARVGTDPNGWYEWYSSDTETHTQWGTSVNISVNAPSGGTIKITVPSAEIIQWSAANGWSDAAVLRLTGVSGSVQIGAMEWRAANANGFHRITDQDDHYSDWYAQETITKAASSVMGVSKASTDLNEELWSTLFGAEIPIPEATERSWTESEPHMNPKAAEIPGSTDYSVGGLASLRAGSTIRNVSTAGLNPTHAYGWGYSYNGVSGPFPRFDVKALFFEFIPEAFKLPYRYVPTALLPSTGATYYNWRRERDWDPSTPVEFHGFHLSGTGFANGFGLDGSLGGTLRQHVDWAPGQPYPTESGSIVSMWESSEFTGPAAQPISVTLTETKFLLTVWVDRPQAWATVGSASGDVNQRPTTTMTATLPRWRFAVPLWEYLGGSYCE